MVSTDGTGVGDCKWGHDKVNPLVPRAGNLGAHEAVV